MVCDNKFSVSRNLYFNTSQAGLSSLLSRPAVAAAQSPFASRLISTNFLNQLPTNQQSHLQATRIGDISAGFTMKILVSIKENTFDLRSQRRDLLPQKLVKFQGLSHWKSLFH